MISIVRTLAVCLIVLGGQFTPSHSNVINFDPPSGGTNDGRQLQNAQPPPPAFLSPPVLNVVNGTISPLDQHFLVMVYNESLQANNATEAASNSTDPRLFPLSVVQPIYLQQLKDIIKNKTLLNALLPGFFPPISRDPTSSTISIPVSHETSSTTLESIINSLDPSLPRPTSAAGPATTDVNTFTTTAGLRYLDITKCGVFPACSVDPKVDEKGDTILVTCHRPVVGLLVAITIILAIVIVFSNLLIIIVTLRTRSLRKPHEYFKISLAFSDLLMGALVLPSVAHNILNGVSYNSEDLKLLTPYSATATAEGTVFGIIGILSSTTTVFGLFMLAIDSFLSVRWPVKYRVGDIMTRPRAAFLVVFIWILGLAISALPLLAKDYLEYRLTYLTFMYMPYLKPVPNSEGMNPAQRFLHGVLYAIFVWGIPFIITWVLTLMTSYESMRMLRHMREARRKSVKSTKALNRVDRDIRRTVLIVLLLFTLTVLPVFIVIMRFMLEPDVGCASKAQSISYYVTTLFLVCGSFCNVIIYNVCNKEFREACLKFFVDILRPCCFESVTALFEHQTSASKRRAEYWKSNASKRSSTARDTKQNGSRSLSASTAITDASRTKSEDGTYPSKVVSTVSTTTYHEENLKNNNTKQLVP